MYSPKIDEELIPKLYEIAKRRSRPMTIIVNEFLKKCIVEEERGHKFQQSRLNK